MKCAVFFAAVIAIAAAESDPSYLHSHYLRGRTYRPLATALRHGPVHTLPYPRHPLGGPVSTFPYPRTPLNDPVSIQPYPRVPLNGPISIQPVPKVGNPISIQPYPRVPLNGPITIQPVPNVPVRAPITIQPVPNVPVRGPVTIQPVPNVPIAPVPHVGVPELISPLPARPISTQFHRQDELGNYDYGYANPNSQKKEARDAVTGSVAGTYSYVDAHGIEQRVDYIADDAGFRATGSNIPGGVAPLPRRRRSVDANAYAVRPAVLEQVQLTPGHAVAYRVY